MNTIRIRKHLRAPIPELPELAPLIGTTVEIIAFEEAEAEPAPIAPYGFWNGLSADELAAQQQKHAVASPETLKANDELKNLFDGFEETLKTWRQEPWRDDA